MELAKKVSELEKRIAELEEQVSEHPEENVTVNSIELITNKAKFTLDYPFGRNEIKNQEKETAELEKESPEQLDEEEYTLNAIALITNKKKFTLYV